MGNTIVLLILGTRTSIDPESNSGGGGAGILASNTQAVVQLGHLSGGYVQQRLLDSQSRFVALFV